MSGSSQSSSEPGIDQILAQIRKVIGDEPRPVRAAPAVPSLPSVAKPPQPTAQLDASVPPAGPKAAKLTTTPGSTPPGLAMSTAATLRVTAVPMTAVSVATTAVVVRPSRWPASPPDDLSDLIETGPPKVAAKPIQQAPAQVAPIAVAPKSANAPAAPLSAAAGRLEAIEPPSSATPAAKIVLPSAGPAQPPAPQTVAIPVVRSATVPPPVPSIPAAASTVIREPETPPLLGEHGRGGKAPVSLAHLVASGTISMPGGVPSSVQPPDVSATPSSATAVPLKHSSALGDLAAGLAASGQAAVKMSAVPVELEDRILEGLRPTVRQWLETNAASVVKGTPQK